MLDFADQPYQYFPPKRNRLIAWLLTQHNAWRYLPRTLGITRVHVTGHESLAARKRAGEKLLLVPNHPTHFDAAIFLEAARQAKLSPTIMAAYDVFLRSRRDAWVMRKLGSFSVDREGTDQRSMKQAATSLTDGQYPLTIFAEGNVYLQNDRITALTDGAAFLAQRTQQTLGEQGGKVMVVPVAIKVTHVDDVRGELRQRIHELAKRLDVKLESTMTPIEALRAVGVEALRRNLKARGFDVPETESLPQMIEHAAGDVLTRLERKLGITGGGERSLIERVRRARRVIHDVRTDGDRVADHAAAVTWADEAMLAFRIASYGGQYVAARPTVDRISETVEKLTEDVHREMGKPWAKRAAYVHFGEPIDLSVAPVDRRQKLRVAVRELTSEIETAIQTGVDAHCQRIATEGVAGSTRWESALG